MSKKEELENKLCAKYVRTEAKGVSNVKTFFAEIAGDDPCSKTLIMADPVCLCMDILSTKNYYLLCSELQSRGKVFKIRFKNSGIAKKSWPMVLRTSSDCVDIITAKTSTRNVSKRPVIVEGITVRIKRLEQRTEGKEERGEGRRAEGEGGEGAGVISTVPNGRTEEKREGGERGVSGVPNGPTDEGREERGGGEGEGQRPEMPAMPAVKFKTSTCNNCSLITNPETPTIKPA